MVSEGLSAACGSLTVRGVGVFLLNGINGIVRLLLITRVCNRNTHVEKSMILLTQYCYVNTYTRITWENNNHLSNGWLCNSITFGFSQCCSFLCISLPSLFGTYLFIHIHAGYRKVLGFDSRV